MRNLDKVWNIWVDLDVSYKRVNYKQNKIEFLKKLVSNGDINEVSALLAKIATDIQSFEDNKKYKYIQESMLAVLNYYDFLPENIDSLNTYIVSLQKGNIRKNNMTFEEFLTIIFPYSALEIKQIDFSLSNVGCEFISSKEVHKVNLCSENALIVTRWMKNDISSITPFGDFGKRALSVLKSEKAEESYPVVLVNEEIDLSNKIIEKREGELYIVCGEASMAVRMI